MAYQQVTRAQFRAQLLLRLGGAAPTFWTTDELNGIIQESLRTWNLLTGFWRTRQTLTTVAGQVWYTLGGSITSSMRVIWNSRPLVAMALYDLDSGQQYWESETTASGGAVPTEPQGFGIGALNLIAIWPADATGNQQLLVDGIAATPVLASDASYIDIGSEELNNLLDYCTHIALFKEGGTEFAATLPNDKAGTEGLLGSFLRGAAKRNATLMQTEIYRQWLGGDVDNRAKNPQRTKAERVGAR